MALLKRRVVRNKIRKSYENVELGNLKMEICCE